MKRYFYFLAGVIVAMMFSACDYNAKYTTKKVKLTMTQKRVSAGFAQFEFETDRPAYFLSGITQVNETTPLEGVFFYQEKFKTLMLDEAYIDYLEWRHDLLNEAVHDITEFHDHTLNYTSAKRTFQFLQPNTRYIVYGFVVDPILREPAGDLQAVEIYTDAESHLMISFSYRVNGFWDYIYPQLETYYMLDNPVYRDPITGEEVEDSGEPEIRVSYDLETEVPWVGALVDSVWLREQGWSHPGAYFIDTFTHVSNALAQEKTGVHYGIYARNNDLDSETSDIQFEQGHTYYAGMATLDGPLLNSDGRPVCYAIYRFRWDGDSTKLYFEPGNPADTRGAW